jgi:uncharacterized protein YcbK (DUF882 family)
VSRLSVNFLAKEFLCPCCKVSLMQGRFIEKLQVARTDLGRPLIINSGYRCSSHNRKVGGVRNSAHLFGLAADLHCNHSQFRYLLLGALLTAGFSRIGIYKYFIHVDCDESKPQGVIWYGKNS